MFLPWRLFSIFVLLFLSFFFQLFRYLFLFIVGSGLRLHILIFAQFLELLVEERIVEVVILAILLKVQHLLNPKKHLIKAINGSIIPIANKGALLIFSNKTDTLLIDLRKYIPLQLLSSPFLLIVVMMRRRKRSISFSQSIQLPIDIFASQRFPWNHVLLFLLLHHFKNYYY